MNVDYKEKVYTEKELKMKEYKDKLKAKIKLSDTEITEILLMLLESR